MASYPIPPWLNVSPGDFGQAAARGAEISLGRQRLAAESAQANQRSALAASELAARREEEQRRADRAEQEIAYQKEYQQAQIGIRQQGLDQAEQQFQREEAQREAYQQAQVDLGAGRLDVSQQELDIKMKAAAEKSQAQQEAQARIRAGEDPSKVWMELGPKIGMTGNAMASLARKPPELGKVTPITLSDGRKVDLVQTGQGSVRVMPPSMGTGTNAVQSVPVLGPDGQEIPGVFGVQGPSGMRIHNVPKESAASSLQKTVEARRLALGKTNAPPAAAAPKAKPAGKAKPTEAAIQHLIDNPDLADQFDAKYGKGEAAKILKALPAPVYDQEE